MLPAFFVEKPHRRSRLVAVPRRPGVRNIAVIAHVDHGKTTVVDAMLWQTGLLAESGATPDDVLAAVDPGRVKIVTTMAKNIAMTYRGVTINVLDTPGQAEYGGDVERPLVMADGVLLIVDASEGPLPQTRYVLRKALEASLAPIVVINKIDLRDARPLEVLEEVRALFADLDASDRQLAFPVLYTDALRGVCRTSPEGPDSPFVPLLDEILQTVPAPEDRSDDPLQLLVANLDYDDYLGRLAMGRVHQGRLRRGEALAHCRIDGPVVEARATGLYGYDGLSRTEIDEAGPGDIVALTGIESVRIGDTLADPNRPAPLPAVRVDEPTIAIVLAVNDSPTAGLDGRFASGAKLRERLYRELLTNATVRVEETDSPDAFKISARGELQLAILIEMMRREGYEVLASRPTVPTREMGDATQEPFELLVTDCPDTLIGVVTEKVTARKGRLTKMVNHGTGRVRMEFRIPSRGLIGFRAEYLNDTRGAGVMTQMFDGYDTWEGEIARRSSGVLVADGAGRATAWAIAHLQPRGAIFIEPGDQVYEGQIVGENSRGNDLDVSVIREPRSTGRSDTTEHSPPLFPSRGMSLEQALEFIREDELVEITPRALRLRKRVLPAALRARKS
ncbi:MAG: GTP-binding protein [Acidobacteriota bacterium]|nr:GTP-binding protein [Acidobacteriota bacterium]